MLPYNAHRRACAIMAKKPSGSSDVLLDRLLAAIGKGDADALERYLLSEELREIEVACSKLRGQPTLTGLRRRLLRKFRANTVRRRELRRQLEPIRDDILVAGFLRANPGADERQLRAALQEEGTENIDPAEIEAIEDQDIAFLIANASDYRKRQVRKLAVEPFLRLLQKDDVIPSRKLPLNRMMQALFDWLGIEKKLRPTDAGIRTIARSMRD